MNILCVAWPICIDSKNVDHLCNTSCRPWSVRSRPREYVAPAGSSRRNESWRPAFPSLPHLFWKLLLSAFQKRSSLGRVSPCRASSDSVERCREWVVFASFPMFSRFHMDVCSAIEGRFGLKFIDSEGVLSVPGTSSKVFRKVFCNTACASDDLRHRFHSLFPASLACFFEGLGPLWLAFGLFSGC